MPRRPHELKEIRWRGDSREVAHDFPKGARLDEAVYVLHALHKKSKAGKATPRAELDLAARRYRELMRERTES